MLQTFYWPLATRVIGVLPTPSRSSLTTRSKRELRRYRFTLWRTRTLVAPSSCSSFTTVLEWTTQRWRPPSRPKGRRDSPAVRPSVGTEWGLPNGALSCSRCVEVFTWRRGRVLRSLLDVDELVRTRRRSLSPVEEVGRPQFLPRTRQGTAVLLRRCDRLEYKRISTFAQRLHEDLGRIYRRFIDRGIELQVNGEAVAPVDPLLLIKTASGVLPVPSARSSRINWTAPVQRDRRSPFQRVARGSVARLFGR
jgi:hypothetical protein